MGNTQLGMPVVEQYAGSAIVGSERNVQSLFGVTSTGTNNGAMHSDTGGARVCAS